MKITDAEIAARGTANGSGFKKDVLAEWGVPFPPPKGWRRALLLYGVPYQPLSPEEMADFMEERNKTREQYYLRWVDEVWQQPN